MAKQALSFMQDGIAANICSDAARRERDLDEWVPEEMGHLKGTARVEGLDLNNLRLEDNLLRDEFTAAIKRI